MIRFYSIRRPGPGLGRCKLYVVVSLSLYPELFHLFLVKKKGEREKVEVEVVENRLIL